MNNASSDGVDSGGVSDPAGSQTKGDASVVDAMADAYSKSPPPLTTIKQGENQMADVDSTSLALGQAAIRHDISNSEARLEKAVGDTRYTVANEAGALSKQIGAEACGINQEIGNARREGAEHAADIRYDVATRAGDIRHEIGAAHCKTDTEVLNARHDVIAAADSDADRVVDRIEETRKVLTDRMFSVSRDVVDTKTQVQCGFVGVTKDTELNALKVQLDAAKNTTYLADKIERDGEKTRALINDLKYHDLNRGLIERNTELVECEADRRHWRHHAEQNQFAGQWAQLQSQIQAFQSQLQETRQGLVNFGTMAGNAGQQSSTSNNVR